MADDETAAKAQRLQLGDSYKSPADDETAAKAQRPLRRQLQKPALGALDETATEAG